MSDQTKDPNTIVIVGSTPGDNLVKSMLSIPSPAKVDFIRWNLKLNDSTAERNKFVLEIHFGEGKQGTPDFIGGGEKRKIEGKYTIAESNHKNIKGEIYSFTSKQLPSGFSIIKLNDNLFHLLSPENKLMVGDGGNSYTLSSELHVKNPNELPVFTTAASIFANNNSFSTVYEGRTPCQELAADHPEMNASSSCHKLKWRLILYSDSLTHQPTNYELLKVVDNQPGNVTGKWKVIKDVPPNPEVVIYQLDPDKPGQSIYLLAGDENILYFIDKNYTLYIGNKDWSYTLNKTSEGR